VHNTGALGTHLHYFHGIVDGEYRQSLVDEVRRRALRGEEPLEIDFREVPRSAVSYEVIKKALRNPRYRGERWDWLDGAEDPEVRDLLEAVRRGREAVQRAAEAAEMRDEEAARQREAGKLDQRVLALVDELSRDEIEEEAGAEEDLEEVEVRRRGIKAVHRTVHITLPAEVLILYDWVRSEARKMGKDISLSEFIRQVVVNFFRERGIGVAVVRLDEQ